MNQCNDNNDVLQEQKVLVEILAKTVLAEESEVLAKKVLVKKVSAKKVLAKQVLAKKEEKEVLAKEEVLALAKKKEEVLAKKEEEEEEQGKSTISFNNLGKNNNNNNTKQKKNVSFQDNPVIHVLDDDDASKEARKGTWHEEALDRNRFKQRITTIEMNISSVFEKDYRSYIFNSRFNNNN